MYTRDNMFNDVGRFQSLLQSMGKNGCYVLSLIEAGRRALKKDTNIMLDLMRACHSSAITLDENDYTNENNFYVKDPAVLLQDIFGGKWSVGFAKQKSIYQYKCGIKICHYVLRGEYNKIISSHFRLQDCDPLQFSKTATEGEIEDYRIVYYLGE